MKFSVREVADAVGGSWSGEGEAMVRELRALEEAREDSLCPYLRKPLLAEAPCPPAAVLTTEALARFALDAGVRAAVTHPRPARALAELIELFCPAEVPRPGIHPSAVVDPSASVPSTVFVGPGAVIEAQAIVGEQCVIGPGAVICAGCRLGRRVIVGPGAVVGSEGFGFVPDPGGPVKVRHVGTVVIEDDVEIGANTCIDRGTLGATVIGRGAKLDNLVQVGHNCRVGRGALLAGQVGLAGSTVIGDGAMLGGKVGVADHVVIGSRAMIAAGSGVSRNVADGEIAGGYPAMPLTKWRRAVAWLNRESAREGRADREDK